MKGLFGTLSVIILVLVLCLNEVRSLKILLVFTFPSKSHYFLGNELGKGLAKLGHDVTIVATYEEKNPPDNYTQIVLHEIAQKRESAEVRNQTNMFDMENISPSFQLFFLSFSNIFEGLAHETYIHPKVQDLLNSNQHFDAVIVEQFLNDGFRAFAHHFNAPVILFNSICPTKRVNNLVSNPENPSYITNALLGFNGDKMTFLERIYNFAFGLVTDLILYQWTYPRQYAIAKQYFPNLPEYDQVIYNVSLVISNSHESIHEPVPHVPNMIDIGGFHVNPAGKLPENMQKLMDDAKEGVIYFSLGSNIEPSRMPKDKKDIILKVLGSRKEKVLWKWDEETLENKPQNVIISKWFPQQGILAHSNCKLFISHGGLLSSIETVHFGTPVLAFPVFGDQKLNAGKIVSKGYGLSLPFSQITETSLTAALNELLGNPKYRENVKVSSQLLQDRPMKPIELADYWIQYVVRHKGAEHLRVAGTKLPLYKYYMLDVFAAIFGLLFSSVFLIWKLGKFVFKRKNLKTKTKSD